MADLLRLVAFLLVLAIAGETPPPGGPGSAAGPAVRLQPERTVRVASRPPYYTPATLRVTAGEAVRWVNPLPAERHGVREVAQAAFSFELAPGGEEVVRFSRPGTYLYRCRFHPWMAGRIIVETPPPKPPPPEPGTAESPPGEESP